ncbi:MAG: amino-acid N-acetyltransferase [Pseudomonadales bacterium]|nr:amino-acid N-acetyltransferase [Pseudomonadales bacterium]
MKKINHIQHAQWFRDSSPYINAHQGKTFVLHLPGKAIEHENFRNIIKDILLLHSLGIKLILVHGAAIQIDRALEQANIQNHQQGHIRITSIEVLGIAESVMGRIRFEIEAALSRGVVNAPAGIKDVFVCSGNFLKAKPIGILDGIDFLHTGHIRKVNTEAIQQQLDARAIVLISPLGFSPSGEVFNINSAEVATEVASAFPADKLVFFCKEHGIQDPKGQLINELQLDDILDSQIEDHGPLSFARQACIKNVDRCHLIGYGEDGALLEELFTRDGSGTQVTRNSYEQIRKAEATDVGGIIELIRPLEDEGILKRRPRELIEAEIERFFVISRDGMIVSCAALYPMGQDGELACLATHPDYRNGNRAERLLNAINAEAESLAYNKLIVLTTQSAHWFTERGFEEVSISTLLESQQFLYNFQRNSKLFTRVVKKSAQKE